MRIIDLLQDVKYQNKKVLEKLISYYINISREKIFAHSERELDWKDLESIQKSYDEYFYQKKPLEYIFGYVEFFGIKFTVNKDTLIPRPETEYMILSVNDFLGKQDKKHILIDIWTWCWVLWLSVASFNKDKISQIYLTEYFPEALEVAKTNKQRLLPETKIDLLEMDLFDFGNLAKNLNNKDIVLVANLPYIPDKMFEDNVEDNVKKREPKLAFVWWEDWLDLYRKMFDQILNFNKTWKSKFTMFLEMLDGQADKLIKEYEDRINFEKVATFHFNIKILKATLI